MYICTPNYTFRETTRNNLGKTETTQPPMLKKTKIIFDKTSKDWVLGVFNKSTDQDGFITESNGARVLTPEGLEITRDQLAVIKKGSEKFIAGDLTSLMKLSKNEL